MESLLIFQVNGRSPGFPRFVTFLLLHHLILQLFDIELRSGLSANLAILRLNHLEVFRNIDDLTEMGIDGVVLARRREKQRVEIHISPINNSTILIVRCLYLQINLILFNIINDFFSN